VRRREAGWRGKKMRVLLTGALGNLGSRTIESLLDQGHEVRCLDLETKKNQKRARRFGNRIETVWGDVRRLEDLEAAVMDREVVLHLAFIIDVLRSEREPEWARKINVGGTRNLLAVMRRSSTARKILFASSIGVYGHSQHLTPPRRITDPVHPNAVYAHHKMECEGLVKSSGLDRCILRYAFALPLNLGGFNPVLFHIELDSRMQFVHPQDVGLAAAKADA
jgi:nucleoside-diphosphate-sugar epimerase